MMILQTLPLLLLLADDTGWKEAAREDGIIIFSRKKKDTNISEMKAVGIIDAAPKEIWKAIRDYPNYPKHMPYTEVGKVLGTEGGEKVTYFYSVINTPLVNRRDYCIRLVDESDWDDPKAALQVSWKATEVKCPPENEDMVRVRVNDGYWRLEPRENGTKTFATYYVFTDPGGAIPNWIANKANTIAVPNVFEAIRKVIADSRKAPSPASK